MMRRGSELEDGGAMLARCVADIGLPAITTIALGERAHDPVARDLGDDRGRRDREAESVALYDRLHRAGEGRRHVAVDECHVRADSEPANGPRHRQKRRAQNVDAVDLAHARRADADMRDATTDAAPERSPAGIALLGGQNLRVIEFVAQGSGEAPRIEDYRGSHDRPCQRATPYLVDAANNSRRAPFEREIRHRPSIERLLPRVRGSEQAKRRSDLGAAARRRQVDRMFQPGRGFLARLALACRATILLLSLAAACLFAESPACAFDLFTTHEVTAQFATADGKPMADAAVRVFAPGDLKTAVETGRTDSQGKFVFGADKDGMWTAEARTSAEVARVMIRVGAGAPQEQQRSRLPPIAVIGAIILLAAMGWWYLLLRMRGRWRKP